MKKRMVSLIVALCMMISLFPVSVFADEGVALCAGQPELTLDSSGRPNGSSGYGWTYSGGVLTLTDGRYNFYSPSTNPSRQPTLPMCRSMSSALPFWKMAAFWVRSPITAL